MPNFSLLLYCLVYENNDHVMIRTLRVTFFQPQRNHQIGAELWQIPQLTRDISATISASMIAKDRPITLLQNQRPDLVLDEHLKALT
ncbi:hypothetical protein H5410_031522, partial [Solanum commersonii]